MVLFFIVNRVKREKTEVRIKWQLYWVAHSVTSVNSTGFELWEVVSYKSILPPWGGCWGLLLSHSNAPSVDVWSSGISAFTSPFQSYGLKIPISLSLIIFHPQFSNSLNKWGSFGFLSLSGKVCYLSSPRLYNPCYQTSNLPKKMLRVFPLTFIFSFWTGQLLSLWFQIS